MIPGHKNIRLGGVLCLALVACVQAHAAQVDASRAIADVKQLGFSEIVFCLRSMGRDGHWYANFGHTAHSASAVMSGPPGGGLYKLDLVSGKAEKILADPKGSVRDPQLHYDGKKILFAYRKGGSRYYHLYEIGVDGSGLRQLTDGHADDFEPIYLPNDEILFCSSRSNRYVACWFVQVGTLYRCDANGKNIRMISSSIVNDNTPWMLPDGRVLYMRWEYVDRSQISFHHLWTINPDGTGQMAFFGNMHPGTAMLDAKPIPGTGKVLAGFSPEHGLIEHWGQVTILDAKGGPDARARARRTPVSARDPYPITEDCFLVAQGRELVLYRRGARRVLFTSPDRRFEVHEPRPVRARPREHVIPDRTDPKRSTGRLVLMNAAHGRNMGGVRPGEIKKLLVLEQLPKPINFSGAQEPISIGGTFTLKRVLGTVPVEKDGSASFEVPALRNLFFVALDKRNMAVKRMQSFVTVQPGEVTSCVGCHERRTEAAPRQSSSRLKALERAPSRIEPIPGVADVLDFPRDIQPILNKRCVACHNHKKRSGRVDLTGDRNEWYSQSYYSLMAAGQVSDGCNRFGNRPPRSIGTSASAIMKKIDGSHHRVKLSQREHDTMRLWVESGGVYPGTYAALGTGMVWVNRGAIAPVFKKRCITCHGDLNKLGRAIPTSRVHNRGPFGPRMNLFNLTHPERSRILLAPLARSASGAGMVRKKDGKEEILSVFKDTSDPDYQAILRVVRHAKGALDRIKRFDMPGFQPRREYVRELKSYGLSVPNPVTDVYALDRAYWRSFHHRPPP